LVYVLAATRALALKATNQNRDDGFQVIFDFQLPIAD